MQNNSLKLILSTLINEFLHASYIRLIIFLSISYKYYYYLFFIRIVFFLNILFFNFWKKRDVEREIVEKILEKEKIREKQLRK
jgi:uncharacterized protein (DUF58 family)